MADNEHPSGLETSTEKPAGLIDKLRSKMTKLTASVTAATVVIGAAATFQKELTSLLAPVMNIVRPEPAAVAFPDCLKANVKIEPNVSLSEWDKKDVAKLTGRNDCPTRQVLFVSFKGKSETIQLEPPYLGAEGCVSGSRQCWEEISVDRGEELKDRRVEVSRLKPMKVPLGPRASLQINWVVQGIKDTMFGAGSVTIFVSDDPQAPAHAFDFRGPAPQLLARARSLLPLPAENGR